MFLLSLMEVNKYFDSPSERRCKPTDYTVAIGIHLWVNGKYGSCRWWLRTPGVNRRNFVDIDAGGYVRDGGYAVSGDSDAVRPAMWINLTA